jgi:hypothetical protein
MSGSQRKRSLDWREYNESLGKRGEFHLILYFLEN